MHAQSEAPCAHNAADVPLTKVLPVTKKSDWTTDRGGARVGQTELALLEPEKMSLIALGMILGSPGIFFNCKQCQSTWRLGEHGFAVNQIFWICIMFASGATSTAPLKRSRRGPHLDWMEWIGTAH